MAEQIFYTPPFVFILVLSSCIIFSLFLSRFKSVKRQNQINAKKAYACGEDFNGHMIQPDYSQFFPFAFFFTILHVVALIIALIPAETLNSFSLAIIYVVGAVIGLFILLRG